MPIGRLGRRGFGPQPFAAAAAAAAVVELFDLFDLFCAFQQLLAAVEFDLMIPGRACFDVSCMTAQWCGDPAAGGCLSLVRCVQQGVVVGPWSWVKSSSTVAAGLANLPWLRASRALLGAPWVP